MKTLMLNRVMLGIFCWVLQSCTSIGTYVEGWPELKVKVHEVSLLEINERCWKYLPLGNKFLGSISFGCAIYNLNLQTCDIYVPHAAPQAILDHELEHCKGGDHEDHSLDVAFSAWLDSRGKVGVRASDIPPRLVIDPYGSGKLTWDSSSRFGPVPAELSKDAQFACAENNVPWQQFIATGYHPMAQDEDGNPLLGGGFYCDGR